MGGSLEPAFCRSVAKKLIIWYSEPNLKFTILNLKSIWNDWIWNNSIRQYFALLKCWHLLIENFKFKIENSISNFVWNYYGCSTTQTYTIKCRTTQDAYFYHSCGFDNLPKVQGEGAASYRLPAMWILQGQRSDKCIRKAYQERTQSQGKRNERNRKRTCTWNPDEYGKPFQEINNNWQLTIDNWQRGQMSHVKC